MRAWQFSKPKGPGFGISRQFYLSALSPRPVLPSMLEIVNPKGEGGALEGFGVPLDPQADKSSVRHPLQRGAYAIATRDRKTVLKTLVMSKEEAGFDPEVLARSALVTALDPEVVNRIRATWTLIQMSFEAHDAAVYPAVEFLHALAQRFALLTDGVVADPISQRYLLPHEMSVPDPQPPLDVREVVAVKFKDAHAYTLGMQKFVLPELEIYEVPQSDRLAVGNLLLSLCQTMISGQKLVSGARLGSSKLPFELREGGLDRTLWHETPVFELLPPTQASVQAALQAWQDETQT